MIDTTKTKHLYIQFFSPVTTGSYIPFTPTKQSCLIKPGLKNLKPETEIWKTGSCTGFKPTQTPSVTEKSQ